MSFFFFTNRAPRFLATITTNHNLVMFTITIKIAS